MDPFVIYISNLSLIYSLVVNYWEMADLLCVVFSCIFVIFSKCFGSGMALDCIDS